MWTLGWLSLWGSSRMFPTSYELPLKSVVMTDQIRETRKIVLLRSAQIIETILRAANTKELTTRVARRSAWQNFRDAISLSLCLPLPPPCPPTLNPFLFRLSVLSLSFFSKGSTNPNRIELNLCYIPHVARVFLSFSFSVSPRYRIVFPLERMSFDVSVHSVTWNKMKTREITRGRGEQAWVEKRISRIFWLRCTSYRTKERGRARSVGRSFVLLACASMAMFPDCPASARQRRRDVDGDESQRRWRDRYGSTCSREPETADMSSSVHKHHRSRVEINAATTRQRRCVLAYAHRASKPIRMPRKRVSKRAIASSRTNSVTWRTRRLLRER